jgi:hypothetical protein
MALEHWQSSRWIFSIGGIAHGEGGSLLRWFRRHWLSQLFSGYVNQDTACVLVLLAWTFKNDPLSITAAPLFQRWRQSMNLENSSAYFGVAHQQVFIPYFNL